MNLIGVESLINIVRWIRVVANPNMVPVEMKLRKVQIDRCGKGFGNCAKGYCCS